MFDTSALAVDLIYRPKDLQDNATPSGNSMAIRNLLILSALTDKPVYQELAENALKSIQETLSQYPTAFGSWLLALDHTLNPYHQLAIVWEEGAQDETLRRLAAVAQKTYKPRLIYARSSLPLPTGSPGLLNDRPTVNGLPTAYYCQDFVCQLPVTDPDALKSQLG
ncbi:thioredoxin domain-containing protein [bacterium]|nr:thioredoxin domain-containing protein [bacterium]